MYLDYINLWSVEKTQALYRASVKFKLPHLCEKAVEYMMAKMSLDSIWPIFDAAIATEDQILSDECKKVSLHAHIVQSTSSLLRVFVADDVLLVIFYTLSIQSSINQTCSLVSLIYLVLPFGLLKYFSSVA